MIMAVGNDSLVGDTAIMRAEANVCKRLLTIAAGTPILRPMDSGEEARSRP